MAGSKTAYLSQQLLSHVLGRQSTYTPPEELFVVLSTNAFDANASGNNCGEVTASDYARFVLPNDETTFTPVAPGAPSTLQNANDIAFPAAASEWGQPASVYLADAAHQGNLLYGADLYNSDDITAGDVFRIYAGTFVFSED